jgi:hypothetical protein
MVLKKSLMASKKPHRSTKARSNERRTFRIAAGLCDRMQGKTSVKMFKIKELAFYYIAPHGLIDCHKYFHTCTIAIIDMNKNIYDSQFTAASVVESYCESLRRTRVCVNWKKEFKRYPAQDINTIRPYEHRTFCKLQYRSLRKTLHPIIKTTEQAPKWSLGGKSQFLRKWREVG